MSNDFDNDQGPSWSIDDRDNDFLSTSDSYYDQVKKNTHTHIVAFRLVELDNLCYIYIY
jgi:hypothetical protein